MSSTLKTVLLWIVVVTLVALLWAIFRTTATGEEITYTAFLERVNAGAVTRVVIRGPEVAGTMKTGATFHVNIPPNYPYTYDVLRTHGVVMAFEREGVPLATAIVTWGPVLALMGIWVYFTRRLRR
jgi:cell division protease FtsH